MRSGDGVSWSVIFMVGKRFSEVTFLRINSV